jgi:hypothetical protein
MPAELLDSYSLAIPPANTATVVGPDNQNTGVSGVKVVVDITAIGTGSWTLVVEGKDKISGKYYPILTSAALVATATTVLTVYPGLTAIANVTVSDVIPEIWRLRLIANNANPVTGTVGVSTLA